MYLRERDICMQTRIGVLKRGQHTVLVHLSLQTNFLFLIFVIGARKKGMASLPLNFLIALMLEEARE